MIKITEAATEVLNNFTLPADLSFGKVMAPVMIEADNDNGKWSEFVLKPYAPITLDPTCKVLHYAQEIFEGLKAYKTNGNGPYLFRPDQNAKRFNESAARMAMPNVPEEVFIEGVKIMTSFCSNLIPTESGASLYIRPFMFATENNLGIKPSEKFKFLILASPSQAYFSSDNVKVIVEDSAVRACPGGVGHAKTGGNYAASLLSMRNAKRKGFDQILWLDALTKSKVEEMSGMNFFAVYGNTLKTPALTETILDGITRKSIISLAKEIGLEVQETSLDIKKLFEDIKSGNCSECFACGTAVIITPISLLARLNGESYPLKHSSGPIAKKLRTKLLGIQEGTEDDPFNWRIPID